MQIARDPLELLCPMDGSLGGEGFASNIDTKLEGGFIVRSYVRHSFEVLMLEMLRIMTWMMIQKMMQMILDHDPNHHPSNYHCHDDDVDDSDDD